MSLSTRFRQKIRRLIEWAGYTIHPKSDYFITDQVNLLCDAAAPIIFDVGANEGKYTQKYRELFPHARLFCMEPIPHIADRLRKGLGGIEVIESALAGKDGTATFHVNEYEDTSSLLASDLDRMPDSYRTVMRPKESIVVGTLRLDTLMERFALERIDILKMDIQGGEYSALVGAEKSLASGRIGLIALEVFLEPYYIDQPLFGDIARLLGKHGYRLYRLYNINFSGTTGRPQWADAIFVGPGSKA